ncbi:hypothetical protein KC19_3G236700 [Ceratodon purpureus]|uniref:Uncharacterized protein n=1 Tax=Ceratodon purpureus TaxID=3225 RepID=A0A8T0IPR6_CERPU|nr:hypothetical protein KC19_3G236700 [Ceratodon purpureus]
MVSRGGECVAGNTVSCRGGGGGQWRAGFVVEWGVHSSTALCSALSALQRSSYCSRGGCCSHAGRVAAWATCDECGGGNWCGCERGSGSRRGFIMIYFVCLFFKRKFTVGSSCSCLYRLN